MKNSFSICLVLLILATLTGVLAEEEVQREETTYVDDMGDVISTTDKRDLSRLIDLEELDGVKGKDFKQSGQVDILSLKIIQDDTFVTFILEMEDEVGTEEQFSYQISGYAVEEPRSTDPYDFRIVHNGTNATYYELIDGRFVENSTVSGQMINGSRIEIRMNRGNFILSQRDDPFVIAAIAYLDEGQGKEIHIDHLLTTEKKDEKKPLIDETTLILIEFGILGTAFLAAIVVWNIYMKKKGGEDQGGICPKCESRLEPSIDFCPSCGTFVRGPNAKSLRKRPFSPPPDFEEEE